MIDDEEMDGGFDGDNFFRKVSIDQKNDSFGDSFE